MNMIPYASAIGSIMYAMLCTRPDIAHALSVTSRYQADPGLEHWKAVKCILKYLRRTKDLLLVYGGNSLKVEGYTDSSFQSDVDDSKSNSGYVYTLNGGAVCWKSSKQDTTADSTTEAEYIAASDAAKEGVWLKSSSQIWESCRIVRSRSPYIATTTGQLLKRRNLGLIRNLSMF